MLLGLLYFAFFGSRMAFLRGATLRLNALPERYALSEDLLPSDGPLKVVTSIPAPPMDEPWWSPVAIVDPDALVEYTLVKGAGNCAAKSRGLGWWLHLRGVPFRLVHLMVDPDIRNGEGHVMVETWWVQGGKPVRGLLDPLVAGVPVAEGSVLTLERLLSDRRGLEVRYEPERPEFGEMRSLAMPSQFASGKAGAVIVGVSSDREVIGHLKFMRRLGAVLPDSLVTRFAGMSASLFLGIYPSTYVPPSESAGVSGILRRDVVFAQVVLWSARAALGCGIVTLVASFLVRHAERRANRDLVSGVTSA